MSKNINREIMVSIQCMAFNHEPYIRQCLDGFVMQKTNFHFEAIIHDDASTDGTSDIIREYERMYPDIIKPIYQIENQYSKHDGSIRRALDSKTRGKYIALCEGDDYWTDPLKLQKQVDFLESHPDYSMVCNRTKLYSQRQGKYIGENYCYNKSRLVDIKDVIFRGGLFISTCSIMLRHTVINEGFPDYIINCHVGDYPLQIFAAMKGKVYYFNDIMSVYRIDNNASWVGQRKKINIKERISTVQSEVDMLNGFANDYPQYSRFFKQRIKVYINKNCPNRKFTIAEQKEYLYAFEDEIKKYPCIWKLDLFIRKLRIIGLMRFYPFASLHSFKEKRQKY